MDHSSPRRSLAPVMGDDKDAFRAFYVSRFVFMLEMFAAFYTQHHRDMDLNETVLSIRNDQNIKAHMASTIPGMQQGGLFETLLHETYIRYVFALLHHKRFSMTIVDCFKQVGREATIRKMCNLNSALNHLYHVISSSSNSPWAMPFSLRRALAIESKSSLAIKLCRLYVSRDKDSQSALSVAVNIIDYGKSALWTAYRSVERWIKTSRDQAAELTYDEFDAAYDTMPAYASRAIHKLTRARDIMLFLTKLSTTCEAFRDFPLDRDDLCEYWMDGADDEFESPVPLPVNLMIKNRKLKSALIDNEELYDTRTEKYEFDEDISNDAVLAIMGCLRTED